MDSKNLLSYLKGLCADLDQGRRPRSFGVIGRLAAPLAAPAALSLALGASGCLEPDDPPLDEVENFDADGCDDGIDNDGDGLVDCADEDCSFEDPCRFVPLYGVITEEICDDGEDNDGDGLVDCDDTEDCDCSHLLYGVPMPERDCGDGEDNDDDGLTDCDDPDCEEACTFHALYAAPMPEDELDD